MDDDIVRVLVALTLAAALLAPLAAPSAVEAHAFLVRTRPQAGERLAASPPGITLRFSEPVERGERLGLAVKRADGSDVGAGAAQPSSDGLEVNASLPSLSDGVYVVSFQVLSTDGHQSIGEFAFGVGEVGALPTGLPGSSLAAAPVAWPDAAASWISLLGLLVALGGLASELAIWGPVARAHGVPIPSSGARWLLVVAMVGSAAQLGFAVVSTSGGWLEGFRSRLGVLALAQLALVGYAWWLVALPAPLARARYLALVPLAAATGIAAVRGHAGTAPDWWAAPANILHLGALALWLGGLWHLILVRARRDALTPAASLEGSGLQANEDAIFVAGARRYANLALLLVGLVLASGAVSAAAQLTALQDLPTTSYGRTLLAKLGLVVGVLAIALWARTRTLASPAGPRLPMLWRLLRWEAGLLVIVVGVAAVLGNVAPPRSLPNVEGLLGPPPLEGPVIRLGALLGTLAVHVAASENNLQVRAFALSGEPAAGGRIDIAGWSPSGPTLSLYPRRCGESCVTTEFPWQPGVTTLKVAVSAKGWEGGSGEFQVAWPPQPDDPELLERVIGAMRSEPTITVTERVSSGFGPGSENTFPIPGEEFVRLEVYAAGGASDIRLLTPFDGRRRLMLYIPGSLMWYLLELDDHDRIVRETIVNPGHLIERTLRYER